METAAQVAVASELTLDGEKQPRQTFGELLPDSSVAEVVLSSDGSLTLLHWNDGKFHLAPQIEVDDVLCAAPILARRVREATRFPSSPMPYGSTESLVQSAAHEIQKYFALSDANAAAAALWCRST
jgi:hypothetical protein